MAISATWEGSTMIYPTDRVSSTHLMVSDRFMMAISSKENDMAKVHSITLMEFRYFTKVDLKMMYLVAKVRCIIKMAQSIMRVKLKMANFTDKGHSTNQLEKNIIVDNLRMGNFMVRVRW